MGRQILFEHPIASVHNDIEENRYYKENRASLFGFLYVYIIAVDIHGRRFHFVLFIFQNRFNHSSLVLILKN